MCHYVCIPGCCSGVVEVWSAIIVNIKALCPLITYAEAVRCILTHLKSQKYHSLFI